MKSSLAAGIVLVLAASSWGTVLLNETFDYADQAALNAAWSASSTNTVYSLDTGFGNPAGSYSMPSPTATIGRLARNLGGDYNGTDAQPVEFSLDIYLPSGGAATLWNGARHYVELRGYSGNAYGSGSLQSMVTLGLNNTSNQAETFSNRWFDGRVYLGPGGEWGCLNDQAGTPERTTGWHNLKAVVKSTQIDFYVDGVLAETRSRPATTYGYDCLALGSGITAGGQSVWVDNVKVEVTPEPATLALLGLAGLALVRRRR